MRTTGEVSRLLDVPEYTLQNLIRHRLIVPPELVLGRRHWTDEDVERARAVLAERAQPQSAAVRGATA